MGDTLVEDDFINIPVLHILLSVVKKAIKHMKNTVGKYEISENWFASVLNLMIFILFYLFILIKLFRY